MTGVIGAFSPMLAAQMNPLEHVLPHTMFHIGWFGVTNHLIMGTLAALLTLGVFVLVARKAKVTGPAVEDHVTRGAFAQFFETICVFLRDDIVEPALGDLTDKYIHYIWTLFFFILFCNILGMVPFGEIIGFFGHVLGFDPGVWAHFGGPATGNLALNVPLAMISLIAVAFIGIREAGRKFFAHFAPVPFKPWPMAFIAAPMVVMEVMSLIIRCGVLAMRLFGTMVAGHLVLAVLVGMIIIFGGMSHGLGYGVGVGVVIVNVLLSLLELFIALIQAFVFTFLTVLFISMSAVGHDHDEHHAEHHDHTVEHTNEVIPGV